MFKNVISHENVISQLPAPVALSYLPCHDGVSLLNRSKELRSQGGTTLG
ncbi:hypothetical protein LEMLEM_LOCUS10251 [Lemmus lemmus]